MQRWGSPLPVASRETFRNRLNCRSLGGDMVQTEGQVEMMISRGNAFTNSAKRLV